MQLIIVESPTKANTIKKFLGKDYKVLASFGHVRDLPKSELGVDVENNFTPKYVIPLKARKTISELKKEAKKIKSTILATDEDREGEAIAWHLAQILELDNPKRIVFHEITKSAIAHAIENPRTIDLNLVNAQQARRILDRIVGYKLSPFLWKKVYRGLSAGRVQSVAVRLIAEREREIQNFKADEYWTISAELQKPDTREKFEARLGKKIMEKIYKGASVGKSVDKFDIKTKEEADGILKELEEKEWRVQNVEKKAVSKNPWPPFTTSTLQQEAFRRLDFFAKQTMRLAQQLYEGVELGEGAAGLITYMRTDSLNLSEDSLASAKEYLAREVGEKYALPSPRRFKTKSKGAQEAHEAIRPSDPARVPESVKPFLDQRQYRLYDLIWRRFTASQMPQALFDATSVDIKAGLPAQAGDYTFRANGQTLKFDGFLKIYPLKLTELSLPELKLEDELELVKLRPAQHFTEPPPRFSEASLIKILEKNGIGRPSTYAPTISTIQERGYVKKNEKRQLEPSEVGFIVNDMLVEHFPEIVDIQFTAKMEEELDEIALGKKEWLPLIKEFYEPFSKHLAEKYESVEKQEFNENTDEVCEKCGKPMIIKRGRFGKFLACSGFPECKNTKNLPPVSLHLTCPKCKEGEIVERSTRRGRMFYGCSRYPKCDFASWQRPSGELCPECSSPLVVVKNGELKCSSKSCDFKAREISQIAKK